MIEQISKAVASNDVTENVAAKRFPRSILCLYSPELPLTYARNNG